MAAGCISRTCKVSSVLLFSSFLFLGFAEATVYFVGGEEDAWRFRRQEPDYLNRWSEQTSFRIGDSLVFINKGLKDSVLLVTKEHYLTCDTSSPLQRYRGGNTTVNLEKSGPYFFISGMVGNCLSWQKVIVVVMYDRDGNLLDSYSAFPPGDGIDTTDWDDYLPLTGGGGMLSGGLVVGFVAALVGSFLV